MFMRYEYLSDHPRVFRSMTGLTVSEFDQSVVEVEPFYAATERKRLARPDRVRAPGAGHPFSLGYRDSLLMTLIWLRQYPVGEVLGYFFGVSEPTARRTVGRMLPALEAAGRVTFRWPNRKQGRSLPEILDECPEVAVVIDTFEQRVRRPKDREKAKKHYSGKKKQITCKTQVCVDWDGHVCNISESVPGPTADITLLKETKVLEMLPEDVGAWGDSAYQGIRDLHPQGLGAHPRRKPHGKPRSPEDKAYNTAFARERIIVEHRIGHLRHFQALQQMYRHALDSHTATVVAVAGVVNRRREWRAIA
ncbi:MAG: transposase family protein [Chloroflexota bacterium]|nr:transposase family protein [Chloroflexota bacterium]